MVILSQKIGFSRQSGCLTPSHSITQSPNLDLRFLTSVLFNVFTFFRLQRGQKCLILPQIVTRIQNDVIAIKFNFIQFNAMQNYSFVFYFFFFCINLKSGNSKKNFPQRDSTSLFLKGPIPGLSQCGTQCSIVISHSNYARISNQGGRSRTHRRHREVRARRYRHH